MSRATGEGVRQSRGSSLVTMPSKSILPYPEPAFPRSKLSQALIDVIALIFFLLFLCSVAASLPLAIVMLFFVGA